MNGEKKNGEAWALFSTVCPWCLDRSAGKLRWAAGECICKDDKVSAALQMTRGKLLSSDAFFAFLRLFYSESALLKRLDESGSKF